MARDTTRVTFNHRMPKWMADELDKKAEELGVPRASLINILVAKSLLMSDE